MRIHYVLIILTLTFMQSHTDRNHENNKCSIISETVQSVPKFAVKIVRLKVYNVIIFLSPTKVLYNIFLIDDIVLHSRSQVRLNLTHF